MSYNLQGKRNQQRNSEAHHNCCERKLLGNGFVLFPRGGLFYRQKMIANSVESSSKANNISTRRIQENQQHFQLFKEDTNPVLGPGKRQDLATVSMELIDWFLHNSEDLRWENNARGFW